MRINPGKNLLPILRFVFPAMLTTVCLGQSKSFEIVYMADTKYAGDKLWLDSLKTAWHATGINLRIKWAEVENDSHVLDWTNVDRALQMLAVKKLNIYIRVSLIFTRARWFSQPGYYTADDFHRRWNAEYYLNPYRLDPGYSRQHGALLTFISPNARSKMQRFYEQVVEHLSRQSPNIKNRVKLIVPALSPDDEAEYPSHGWMSTNTPPDTPEMTGYARLEQYAFIQFLQATYNRDVNALNRAWQANFTAIDTTQIKIAQYNWHRQQGPKDSAYQYPLGRKNWIDFKAGELKKFLEELSAITKRANFKFGLQFGSFYGNDIVYRGFYDPASLLEKIDFLITDDVVEYEPNFKFSADYARSLCKYWDWRNSRAAGDKIKFATEINWPEYNNYSSRILTEYWTRQLRAFYSKGASALFVSHWGTTDTGEAANAPARVKNGVLRRPYAQWARTLASYKGAPVQNISPRAAAHLSCEQGLAFRCDSGCGGSADYFYNNGVQVATNPTRYEFPLYRFLKRSGSSGQNNARLEEGSDIVTNYMLINSPEYVTGNYTAFNLNATSAVLPAAAHQVLRRNDLKNILAPNAPSILAKARVE